MAYPSPRRLQLRRGNAAAISTYLGYAGELVVDTSDWTLYVHDGVTVGGYAATVNTASITGNLNSILNGTAVFGNIIPSANAVYSLGNITHQWKSLFVSNSTIYIGGVPLSIDATGNLTINGNTIPTVGYVNAAVANVTVDLSGYALNANVTAANVGLKGYVDQGNTIQSTAITQANLGMKGYVDNAVASAGGGTNYSNVNVAAYLTTNQYATQTDITTANVGLKGYVDQANTIQSAQIASANVGMKGYVDSQSFYSNSKVATYLPTYSGNIANVTLGPSGLLTLPGTGTVGIIDADGYGTGIRTSNAGSYYTELNYNDDQYFWLDSTGINVGTNWLTASKQWTFGTDGSTTLPTVLGGDTTIGTAWNTNPPGHTLTLKHNGGVNYGSGGELKFDYGNVKLKVVQDAGITQTWQFNSDGKLTFPDGTTIDTGTFTAASNSSVNLLSNNTNNQIQVSDTGVDIYTEPGGLSQNNWNFGTDGILTLPNGGLIDSSVLGLPTYIEDTDGILLSSGLGGTGITVGPIGIGAVITANTSQWVFQPTGNLVLPTGGYILNSDNTLYGSDSIYSNAKVSTYLASTTAQTFGGNVTIQGNLIVNGTTSYIITNNLVINDNIVNYANANPADSLDLGFVAHRTPSGQPLQHTGLVRDASANQWRLFSNVVPAPGATVDFTDAIYDDFVVGNITSPTITALTANAATQSDLIIAINANLSLANTIQSNQLSAANTAIVTANTAMKAYVDGQITAANTASYANAKVATYLQVGNIANISVAGNVTATYFIGNGALLTGVATGSSYSNVQVATYLPTYTGNLSAGNANIAGNLTVGSYISTSGTGGNISGVNYYLGNTALITSNVYVTAGNVTAQYFIGNGSQLTGLPSSYSNINAASYLITNGYVNTNSAYGNANTASYLITNGYVNTNSAYANSNVASYLITNQYITAGSAYGNGNVASYLPTYTGNVGGAGFIGTTANIQLITDAYITTYDTTGNVAFGNAAYPVQISAAGNISTARFLFGNATYLTGLPATYSNVQVATYLPTYGGNITAQNITVSGNINLTGNILQINSAVFYGNTITGFNSLYAGIPGYTVVPQVVAQFTENFNGYAQLNSQNINSGNQASTDYIATANNGTDATYFVDLGIAGSGYDPAVGANNNALGTVLSANDAYLYTAGNTATQTGGNLAIGVQTQNKTVKIFAGGVNANNVVLTIANTGITTSNVTASYYQGSGQFLSSLPGYAYSNVNVAAYTSGLTNYSNVNTAAYLNSLGYNLYSNVNVIAYLAGNITVGNVTATYFTGNGAFLTGLPAGYSNVQVAAYLNTQGYNLYSNVNTKAYTESIGLTNYSNVNVKAYTETMGLTNYSNVNVASYLSTATINTTGNITAAYVSGNISITGNVTGTQPNVTIQAGVYTSVFDNQGNVTVPRLFANGNIQTTGYIFGNGAFLTGIVTSGGGSGTNYSNVNVQAYTETMGFTNYSNVNVAAYLNTQGYNLYSNVNTAAYLSGASSVIVGNTNPYSIQSNNTTLLIGSNTAITNGGGTSPGATYILNNVYFDGNGQARVRNTSGGGLSYFTMQGGTLYFQAASGSVTANATTAPGTVFQASSTGFSTVNSLGITASGALTTATGVLVSSATTGNLFNTTANVINLGGVATQINAGAANVNLRVGSGTGNVTAGYFIGDGQFLTSLPGYAYSNVNVAAYLTTNGYINNNSSYGNSNVASYLPTYTGNISAGNANIAGNLTVGSYISTTGTGGNISGVNFYLGNLAILTGNITAAYYIGSGIYLSALPGYAYSNVNVAAYTQTMGFTNYSNVNVAAFTSGLTNYSNVNTASYLGVTQILVANIKLGPSGNIVFADGTVQTTAGGGSYSNVNVATYLPTYSGNIANVRLGVAGVLTFADGTTQTTASAGGGSNYGNGNVASYLITNAYVNTNSAYGNGNAASYLITNGYVNTNSAYGNGNVTSYLPTHSGNVGVNNLIGTTPNVTLVANSYSTTYDIYGNVAFGNALYPVQVYATGNISTSGYLYGNGAFLTGIVASGSSYGNTQVAQYLQVGNIANISVAGNVTASYFLGNGALLTGLAPITYGNVNVKAYTESMAFTNYSNVNVAAYLAGPVTTGNLTVYGANGLYFANITGVTTPAYGGSQTWRFFTQSAVSGGAGSWIEFPDKSQQTTAYPGANAAGVTSLTLTGNITAANFIGNVSTNLIGNIQGTNSNVQLVAGVYTSTFDNQGNVAFGNAVYPVQLSAAGNISTAGYLFGNGSQLTGLPSTYSNVQVVTYLSGASSVIVGNTNPLPLQANITQVFVGNQLALYSGFSLSPTLATLSHNVYYDAAGTQRYRNTQTGAVQLTTGGSAGFQFAGTTTSVTANAATGMGLWAQITSTGFITYNTLGITSAGTLTTSTGVLVSGVTTGNLFNTVATTVNLGGAATVINAGASNVVATFGNGTGNIVAGSISGNLTGFGGNVYLAGNIIVGPTGYTVLPTTVAQFTGNANTYTQINLQNLSTLSDATAEYVATANNGTDTTYFVDLGIANSNYDVNSPNNSLGTTIYPNDSYLYAQGNLATTTGGNLAIGTTTANKSVKIFAGGINAANIVVTVSNTGIAVNGFANITTASGNADSQLVLMGNVSKGGASYHDFLRITSTASGITNPNKYLRLDGSGTLQILNSAYNAQLMTIADSGAVTIPGGNLTVNGTAGVITPNRPAFRVYGSGVTSNQTTSNVNLKGSVMTVDYNQGNYFNSTTGQFIAPVAGLYQVHLIARVGNNNGLNQIAVLKNGNLSGGNVACFWETDTNVGVASHFGTSSVVKLAVGDYLAANIVTGQIQFDSNDSWSVTYIG